MEYFVISDIHSFCEEMKKSLKEAGFDGKNKNHTLIICGDLFDRGPDPVGVYNFIMSIPKCRRILIRGNHEALYLDLLRKGYPEYHDFTNCTVDTFKKISGIDDIDRWLEIKNSVLKHPITKWLISDEWKNYKEIGDYIFVHSFIPTKIKKTLLDEWGEYVYKFAEEEDYIYDPNWRKSKGWSRAIWGCPYKQYQVGLFNPEKKKGKVLVCGHWHTSDFYYYLKGISGTNMEIYYSKNLIGIDGGVYLKAGELYHPQNVLVIKDNICYDKSGNKLKEKIKKNIDNMINPEL